jgi:hypothetical protein
VGAWLLIFLWLVWKFEIVELREFEKTFGWTAGDGEALSERTLSDDAAADGVDVSR